jgi:hypothetical protein
MTSLKVRMRAPSTTQACPHCQGEMTLARMTPISSADGLESVTYRCGQCRSEVEQTYCSRRIQPVQHLPHPTEPAWRRGGFERVG